MTIYFAENSVANRHKTARRGRPRARSSVASRVGLEVDGVVSTVECRTEVCVSTVVSRARVPRWASVCGFGVLLRVGLRTLIERTHELSGPIR